jgi:hypothetical protein
MMRNRAAGIRTSAIWAGRGTTRGARSLVAATVFTALCASAAVAQDWPTKAIRAIVPLTAGAMPGDIESCRSAGSDTHLAKPVSQRSLVHVIRRHSRAGIRKKRQTE